MQILFEYFYGCIYLYLNKLSAPGAVATQGKLSAWGIPQKFTGLSHHWNPITRCQGYGQIRDQWLYPLLGKSFVVFIYKFRRSNLSWNFQSLLLIIEEIKSIK